jgi:hypothetical protein
MSELAPGWSVVLIVLYALAAHGALLLNNGVYWDGWMVDSWHRNRNWSAMRRFFSEVGLPAVYYQHRLMARLGGGVFGFRLLAFVTTVLSALAVYALSLRLGALGDLYSLLLALLYLSYAGYHMNTDTNVGLQYTLPTAIFYWAAYVALAAQDQSGAGHLALRVIALLAFLIAFNANSLLVYYFGFLGLKLLLAWPQAGDLEQAARLFVANLDYIALPFLFWILKERLTPRHGFYMDYNRISIRPLRVMFRLLNAVRSGLEAPVSAPLRTAAAFHYLWIPIAAFAAAFYAAERLLPIPPLPEGMVQVLLLGGPVLLILAALPYALVGQQFAPAGWATKHHMLFHLPVAMIVLGVAALVLPPNFAFAALVLVLAANAAYLLRLYLYYIAVVAKERSWLHKLKALDGARQTAVFSITDHHSIQGDPVFPQNSPAYAFYMFEWLWGEKTHLGIHVPPQQMLRIPPEVVATEITQTSLDYEMGGIDVRGPQARLHIHDGAERSPMRVALRYLKACYAGAGLEQVLDEVTELRFERL